MFVGVGVIQPSRVAVWRARRYSSGNGTVRAVDRHFAAGHWRVLIVQTWHRWEMWYPGTAAGLARAERQRRNAEALR